MEIRQFSQPDTDEVIALWNECNLLKSWNNPLLDIQRKLSYQSDLFFVGELNTQLIASAMFGYDGHRGWLYYFAVLPQYQKKGYGRQLLSFGEAALSALGCPKINLQVRETNGDVIEFYKAADYHTDSVISLGKRLLVD